MRMLEQGGDAALSQLVELMNSGHSSYMSASNPNASFSHHWTVGPWSAREDGHSVWACDGNNYEGRQFPIGQTWRRKGEIDLTQLPELN